MFNATYFTYDGRYSGSYNLRIATFNVEAIETTSAFAPTLNVVKSTRGRRFFYSGINYEEAPEVTFGIISERKIPDNERREVLAWLVGRRGFRKLQIHQLEYDKLYFNCIFTKADIIYVNGYCCGFTLTAKFDSPYCYGEDSIKTVTSDGGSVKVKINNLSDILDDFVYPLVSFKVKESVNGTDIVIQNVTDGNRLFLFSGLENNEQVTVDNDRKIIESSIAGEKLSKFNKNWLRLKPGVNELNITINGTATIRCPTYVLLGF